MDLSRSPSPPRYLPSELDCDSSEASFRPCADDSDTGSDTDPSSIDRTSSKPSLLPASRPHSDRHSVPGDLPEYSDDPDDDTDEDIHDVPLDYGRSENTKVRRERMEQRWHKLVIIWP